MAISPDMLLRYILIDFLAIGFLRLEEVVRFGSLFLFTRSNGWF